MRLAKGFLQFLKLWSYAFLFVLVGQLRFESKTLENYFHSFINAPQQAQFFAKILFPVHQVLDLFAYPVDLEEIERLKSSEIPKEPPSSPLFGPEKLNKMKENLEERQRILKEADQGSI